MTDLDLSYLLTLGAGLVSLYGWQHCYRSARWWKRIARLHENARCDAQDDAGKWRRELDKQRHERMPRAPDVLG